MLSTSVVSGSGALASEASPAPGSEPVVTVKAAAVPSLHEAAVRAVESMTVRERAASVVMGHIPTTEAARLRDYMATTGIGGFILMGANIPADESSLREVTAALTVDPAFPPLLAIDQEGGDVSRLPWDGFPSSLQLKDAPPAHARDAFAARAALVQRAGIGVNFGIVADETADPGSFIHRRSLGTSPAAAAERVAAAVAGEGETALSTLKHFPGHGAAPGDSHAGIPSTGMTKAEWKSADAVPFAAGIEAGAPLLMFGHLAYTSVDATPASLSPEWHRIAREEMGFDGIAVTDDLGMLEASGIDAYADPVANAVTALAAGNDLVLAVMFSTPDSATAVVDGIVAAVDAGTVPAGRLEEAAVRVAALRLELAAAGRGLVPCPDCEPAA
nr:glycoside hydrolase family 3 N-terminal domain-containing protein [Microbacterium sp. MF43]